MRSAIKLGVLTFVVFFVVVFLDSRFRVLPQALHNHLPAHHDGLIATDITVKTCSRINPLSSCNLDPEEWHRVEKDLYLNKGWTSQAFLHIKRRKEEELKSDEKVVIDVKCGRLDPAVGEKNKGNEKWESRKAGIWILRSTRRHESDSREAVTSVDVLFGADAVEPRPGWTIQETPLLLDLSSDSLEAYVTIRHGRLQKVDKPTPRIRKDGRFKIMQIADLHLSTGLGVCRDPEPPGYNGGVCDADPRTLHFVSKLLDYEEPDLVVLSGDQINGETAPDAQSAIFKIAELLVKRKNPIPYAAIFGNHDDEGSSLSRVAQMSLLESLPYSLSEAGPATVDGVGNYVVEVLAHGNSQHSALSLYMLDTHSYSPDERQFRGYDWLKENQINWFRETSEAGKRKHKQYTKIHMDMAFIHIPLPEYRDDNEMVGKRLEPVTAPGFNSGFHDALIEEGVLAVSCGHDHANDYCSLSTAGKDAHPALWMCYGGGSGFGGYGGYGGYHRRVRFFEIDTNSARITTWKRLEYGDTDAKLDEQIIVDGGAVIAG
ncbi:MAG: hypothetical protein M1828_000938 [Chrysothrix sp. TS-e1954]|nr:MAG: hypothetical protein M1828_000938 [Chrysothrix sp. TS-e1954]